MKAVDFLIYCSLTYASLVIANPTLAGPSFDCAKATTRAEKAICQDAQLSELDANLLATLKAALEKNPDTRDQLLSEERQWVRDRDQTCAPLKGTLPPAEITTCLRNAYQKRIEVLRLVHPVTALEASGDPNKAVCHKIVDRYKALVAADPEAPFRKNAGYAETPLELLAETKTSAVTIEAELWMEGYNKNPEEVVKEWVKKQTPISSFSKELSVALSQFAGGTASPRFSFSPGMGLFRISDVGGTANCNFNIFLSVKDGQAQLANEPDGWSEEAGACGFAEALGTVDGTPFAFDYEDRTGQSSGFGVYNWDGDKFTRLCGAVFEFSPRFLLQLPSYETIENCKRADCDALRKAALDLVETSNAVDAEKRMTEKLLPSQRAEFKLLQGLSKALHKEDDPQLRRMTDQNPLIMPLILDNKLYLARVGQFTRGISVIEPDWSVVLEQRDKDSVSEVASFAIGMTNGKLLKANVH